VSTPSMSRGSTRSEAPLLHRINCSTSSRCASKRIRPRRARPVELPPEPVEITPRDRGVTRPRGPDVGHTGHRGHRFRLRAR
jgi:hypothetical protein